jgi:hypothetical protein
MLVSRIQQEFSLESTGRNPRSVACNLKYPDKGKPVARPGRKAKDRRKVSPSDGSLVTEGMPCGGRFSTATTIASAKLGTSGASSR